MPSRALRTYPLHQSPLFRLTTKRRLATLLRLTEQDLHRLTRGAKRYKEWDEPKRSGGTRHIENPCQELKRAQGKLRALFGRITPPEFLTCPVRGRSYVTNAAIHAAEPVVRTLDIKDFFASTLSRRVFWFFRTHMECSEDVAGILTALATVNGHLATGSPLSPILAYWTHVDMWESIATAVHAAGCKLTVYMDDLTVSGSAVSGKLMWQIKQSIDRCGLRYAKEKHYYGSFAEITGIIVRNGNISLPHRQHLKMHNLREALKVTTDNEERILLERKLKGCQGQAKQIRAIPPSQLPTG